MRDAQIHGMLLVKLALALSLAGGVARSEEHLRGDVHLLLIGDPGIGAWGTGACACMPLRVACCERCGRMPVAATLASPSTKGAVPLRARNFGVRPLMLMLGGVRCMHVLVCARAGKSQLMKFAARVAHRSVVTSGRGTTGAVRRARGGVQPMGRDRERLPFAPLLPHRPS